MEQVCILRIRDGEFDLKILSRDNMEKYIELFNKLTDLFYMVYDLNQDWGDLL